MLLSLTPICLFVLDVEFSLREWVADREMHTGQGLYCNWSFLLCFVCLVWLAGCQNVWFLCSLMSNEEMLSLQEILQMPSNLLYSWLLLPTHPAAVSIKNKRSARLSLPYKYCRNTWYHLSSVALTLIVLTVSWFHCYYCSFLLESLHSMFSGTHTEKPSWKNNNGISRWWPLILTTVHGL